MSDRQKGLLDGMKTIFPDVEHRYCLRHLYSNFSATGFKAMYAYREYDFKQAMEKIKELNIRAYKWLAAIDYKH